MNDSLPYVPALTGLRAWAFGLVLLDHWVPFFHHLLMTGNGGVSLFLVLSGYLISRGLITAKVKQTPFKGYLLHFFRRRVQRIFPLYFFVLFTLLIMNNEVIQQHWPYFFTFTANYYLIDHPNSQLDHLWSLSAEEQLYVVIPFLIWLCPLHRLPLLALILIGASCLFRGTSFFLHPGPQWWAFSYESALGCLDCYGIGLLVAYLLAEKPAWAYQFFSSVRTLRLLLMVWGTVLLLGILWEVTKGGTYSNPATAVCVRLAIAVFGGYLIGYCHSDARGRWTALLTNPVCQYLGRISYGLYLFHNLIYNDTMPPSATARRSWRLVEGIPFFNLTQSPVSHHQLELSFYLLLTICLATFSWYFLEKPCLTLSSKRRKLSYFSYEPK